MVSIDDSRGVDDGHGRRLDQIRLSGIAATGFHGVFEHERREGQRFVADVVAHLDTRRAAARDDLAHTLDYGALGVQVQAVLAGDPVDLIETLAERIAATVLAHAVVQAVDVTVHKPQAPITVPFDDVVVSIRRDRSKLPAAEPYAPPAETPARAPEVVPTTTAPFPVTPAPGSPVPPPASSAPAALSAGLPDGSGLEPGALPGAGIAAAGLAGAAAGLAGSAAAGALPEAVATASAPVPPPVPAPPPVPLAPIPAPPAPAASPARAAATGQGVVVANDPDAPVTGELVLDALDQAPAGPVDVVLAIGANLGSAQETLRSAVDHLRVVPGVQVVDVSALARTSPVGGPEQPDYLNAVVLARTTLAPRELLRAVQAVEQLHGRERHERWGPRTLDIDIVVYGTVLAVTDDLELPHPRAHERAFVLQPWAQVDPGATLPGLGGGPVAALAATAPDRDGVRWLALDWLTAPVPAASPDPGTSRVADPEG